VNALGDWVVGITELRRAPAVPRSVHLAGPLPGLHVADVRVPDDADVTADLDLEVLVDGGRLTAIGVVRAPWAGECRRCLQPVDDVLEVPLSEVFEADPADGADTYPLAGDRVDLEAPVRDAVLLGLPLAPLCRDDCPGPDPDGHPVALDDEDLPISPEADPRWAALGELKFD
jgi:uncharacterized protein